MFLGKKALLAVAAAAVLGVSGCANVVFLNRPVSGGVGLFTETQSNEAVTQNPLGNKTGKACAKSILGIINTGDASVATAAREAGITRISTVDNTFQSIVGIVATYCVVVSGS